MSAALHAYPRAWTHANKYIGMSEGIDKPQAFTWRERKRRKVHRSFLPELLAWQATRVLRGRTSGRRKRKSKRKGSRKGLVERGMEQQTHSEVIYLRLATGIDWFEGWEGGGWQCKWRKCEVSFPMDFIKWINRCSIRGNGGINLFLRVAFDCTEVKRYWG